MKKKRKKLPGVTLLELIIVMAIFSGISVGALAMVRPAMQLHYKTAAQERAVAAVDTMARFIQDNLRYANNMFVFINHGIKDNYGGTGKKGIDIIQDYPFDYYPFGLNFICQKWTRSFNDANVQTDFYAGDVDPHHYANPVSFFSQYYFEESICYGKSEAQRNADGDAYFKDKVIYVMEIKNDTAEINVYSYPLLYSNGASVDRRYLYLNEGGTYGSGRLCSSISDIFSGGNETVTVSNVSVGADPSDGLSLTLSITYKGVTSDITLDYDISANFMNIFNGDTIHVNDRYPYNAKRYIVFDWKDKGEMYSKSSDVGTHVQDKGYPEEYKTGDPDPGYTYIVYSLPEIIP